MTPLSPVVNKFHPFRTGNLRPEYLLLSFPFRSSVGLSLVRRCTVLLSFCPVPLSFRCPVVLFSTPEFRTTAPFVVRSGLPFLLSCSVVHSSTSLDVSSFLCCPWRAVVQFRCTFVRFVLLAFVCLLFRCFRCLSFCSSVVCFVSSCRTI